MLPQWRNARAAGAVAIALWTTTVVAQSPFAIDCRETQPQNGRALICEYPMAGRQNDKLIELYSKLQAATPNPSVDIDKWLDQRDSCADVLCLDKFYGSRNQEIQALLTSPSIELSPPAEAYRYQPRSAADSQVAPPATGTMANSRPIQDAAKTQQEGKQKPTVITNKTLGISEPDAVGRTKAQPDRNQLSSAADTGYGVGLVTWLVLFAIMRRTRFTSRLTGVQWLICAIVVVIAVGVLPNAVNPGITAFTAMFGTLTFVYALCRLLLDSYRHHYPDVGAARWVYKNGKYYDNDKESTAANLEAEIAKSRRLFQPALALKYVLGEREQAQYATLRDAFRDLVACKEKLYLDSSPRVDGAERKHHGGASYVIETAKAVVGFRQPDKVRCNELPPVLGAGNVRIYFFPGCGLITWGNEVRLFLYSELSLHQGRRVVQCSSAPSDATVVGYSWTYANKNGGPDRRFKDNPRVPEVQFDTLDISIDLEPNHVDTKFYFSKEGATHSFVAALGQISKKRQSEERSSQYEYTRAQHEAPHRTEEPAKKAWYEILGVSPQAKLEEIKRAYHLRMSEYHPDKVVQLGAELRELAEKKSKEINRAYEEARALYP